MKSEESTDMIEQGPLSADISKKDNAIIEDKQFRKDLDAVLQRIKATLPYYSSRERSICITKLQEAIMWLGMDLKALGGPNPYPDSYNPENTKVEPTADGLKL